MNKKGFAFLAIFLIGLALLLLFVALSFLTTAFLLKNIFLIVGAGVVIGTLFITKGKFNQTTLIMIGIGAAIMALDFFR